MYNGIAFKAKQEIKTNKKQIIKNSINEFLKKHLDSYIYITFIII